MNTKEQDRERRIPTGTGQSGSIVQEYFPGADARAGRGAGHLAAPPGAHAVGRQDAEPRTGTRQELNVATHEQRLGGLVAQMEGDVATGRLAPAAVRYVLEERLWEAGIGAEPDEIARLAALILSEKAPTDLAHGEPGATPHARRR
jgi:hypothetical protein